MNSRIEEFRWALRLIALAVVLGALIFVVVVVLTRPLAAQTSPRDLPILLHRDVGVTVSQDSRVMRELARDPVWVTLRCPPADNNISLAYVRAKLIAPLDIELRPGWHEKPTQPILNPRYYTPTQHRARFGEHP